MTQRGNAFLYILIAIILFAALTYTIMRANEGDSSTSEISESRAEVAAASIIAYAAAAQNAIIQLDRVGTTAENLDFTRPSELSFNDNAPVPKIHKLFHPEGGGLSYKSLPKDAEARISNYSPGYFVFRIVNFEWTPTTAHDVVFTAYGLNELTCKALNRKITGSPVIPTSVDTIPSLLLDTSYTGGGANGDMLMGTCTGCDEKPALCFTDGTDYAFYSILVPQ